MQKDTYSAILAEVRLVVNQMSGLKKRIFNLSKALGKKSDELEIEKIKKNIKSKSST